MQRSRIVQTLNVPRRYAFRPSLAAGLLDSFFEHPAVVFSTVPHVRGSEVPAC